MLSNGNGVGHLALLALVWMVGLCACDGADAGEAPIVFRAPERISPGDTALLYGGNLAGVDSVVLWRLPDTDPGQTATPAIAAPGDASTAKPLQPTDNSVKFVLPATLQPGVFAAQVRAGGASGAVTVLNRPQIWFAQPTTLQPGLAANVLPPGAGAGRRQELCDPGRS